MSAKIEMQQDDHDDPQQSLSECIPKYTHYHQQDNIIQSFTTAAGQETTRAITQQRREEEEQPKEQTIWSIG